MNVCFLGINGIGMSAISKYLSYKGFTVYGIDLNPINANDYNDFKKHNVKILDKNENHSQYIDKADIVVYSSAISKKDDYLNYAKSQGKAIFSRGQMLGEILGSFHNSIGVAGSHGKTTATAMLSHVLYVNKISFTTFIGGYDNYFNNCYFDNQRENIVSEICEYDKNIRYQSPKIALLLNVDNDHLDCYENMDNLILEFTNYLNRSNYCFINADDKHLKKVRPLANKTTFAIDNNADYRGIDLISNKGKYSFKVQCGKEVSKQINLNVFGRHNVYNALGVIAVCKEIYKLNFDKISNGLSSFTGVKRRFDYIGDLFSHKIIADYCHHPTEINSTLNLAREIFKEYIVVFEPHTYSRTKLLLNDFIDVLKGQNAVIYKTFSARENYDESGSGKTLCKCLSDSVYVDNYDDLLDYIKNLKNKKPLLVLGAGELYEKLKNTLNK